MTQQTQATLHTSMGDIVIELFPNHAPKTVANFIELATGAREWTDPRDGKKTPIDEYRLQGRGGIGIKAAKIDEDSRGVLVSALVLRDEDEVLAITSAGTVMCTPAAEVRQTGRDSMGVRLVNLADGVHVVSVTKSAEN